MGKNTQNHKDINRILEIECMKLFLHKTFMLSHWGGGGGK